MMMMDQLRYDQKSPEKSSPSFPEDVEDDDEDPAHLDSIKYTPCKMMCTDDDLPHDRRDPRPDVTMLADDEDDDFVASRAFAHTVDSPRHPNDSSEKKVHWSNQNVQTLLDCVEKHLDEFSVHKKHKQVWQTIGSEMENLGFTMEHCYNKWKNLRRDVRLLVNNPQKAVRNADILRRVARLILVIYPNIDATTMQVSGERNGGRSAPVTPVSLNSFNHKLSMHSSLHEPDSPRYILPNASAPITPGFPSVTSNGLKHRRDTSVPGTALFTNLTSDNDAHEFQSDIKSHSHASGGGSLPFLFSPAAAALLVQSQLFTDLIRQQQQQQHLLVQDEETSHLDDRHTATSLSNACFDGQSHNIEVAKSNGTRSHPNEVNQQGSMASNLLNGLISLDHGNGHGHAAATPSTGVSESQHLLDRLPPGSELASVVERLRDEEAVHLRLTDMVTHIADELRAAGLRRRATLDQLLDLMQGSRLPNNLLHTTAKQTDTPGNLV